MVDTDSPENPAKTSNFVAAKFDAAGEIWIFGLINKWK